MPQTHVRLQGPAAWLGPDLAASEEWVHELSQAEVAEVDAALWMARASGLPLEQLPKTEFPLPTMAASVAGWLPDLEAGCGFVVIRGLPVESNGDADSALVYWSRSTSASRPTPTRSTPPHPPLPRGPDNEETIMANHTDTDDEQLREKVSERYGQIARQVIEDPSPDDSCCGNDDPITRDLYTSDETAELPQAAAQASLGCGNPTALTELRAGEIVLDLGSGGGIDVLLSARRVGPRGKAYGLDMTDDMLELARQNQRDARVDNVEFLKGHIEDIPLPDDSVDVIISNCVINLSSDKGQVLREAFRVLRPGGRFAVSDVVVRGAIDPRIRSSVEAWIGCVAGALDEDDYRSLLTDAGFTDISVEPTRVYELADAEDVLAANGIDIDEVASVDGQVMSAFVRATKA